MSDPEWRKSVYIDASRTEHGRVDFRIVMGATGPRLVMAIGDEAVVIASRWQDYTTEHGNKQIVEAIREGVQALKERVPR